MAETFSIHMLEQNEIWVTRDDRTLRLEDMNSTHRKNLLAFLARRKVTLNLKMFTSYFGGYGPTADGALALYEREVGEFVDKPVDTWFEELPLVRRLRELIRDDDARERRLALNLVRNHVTDAAGPVRRRGGLRRDVEN
jgi:hypothetical protein